MAYQYNPTALSIGNKIRRFGVPFIIVALLLGAAFMYFTGRIGNRQFQESKVPQIGDIQGDYKKTVATNVAKIPVPKGEELGGKKFLTINIYDWQPHSGIIYANGGGKTLEDSLIGTEGLNVNLVHQDDTNMTLKDVVGKVKEFKDSGGKTGGNLAFTIMGNAAVSLVEPINAQLKALDPSYRLVGVDLFGKSDGEDQGIGPVEWMTNPDAAKGKFIIGVYDDGDIQLVALWCKQVGLKLNLDTKTYNPNALNVINVGDFILAGKMFIAGTTQDPRPVIDDNGRKTGKTTADLGVIVKGEAVASWTPVDRNIYTALKSKDPGRLQGLGTFTSTGAGEQRKVMPTLLVVFNKWAEANSDKLSKMLYATHSGSLQVEAYPDAFQKAMEYNSELLGTWDGDATDKASQIRARAEAYKGYMGQGTKIRIGGSTVFSFQDTANMLSIGGSSEDLENSMYASTYRVFGDLMISSYPEKEIKSYTKFSDFFDARYFRAAYSRAKIEGIGGTELQVKQEYDLNTGDKLGSDTFRLEFDSGKSTVRPDAMSVLRKIQDQYAGNDYAIQIIGHTDRAGGDIVNLPLSKARADAVKDALIKANPQAFGGKRITTDGKGSGEPPPNAVFGPKGDCAACRRVVVVISRQ